MSEIPISNQDPSYTARNQIDYAERRKQVEEAFGPALDETFTRNADFVVQGSENTPDRLTLYLPWREGTFATFGITRQVDETENRTFDLSFESKYAWSNYIRYQDGPDQSKQLVNCSKDPKTGQLVPLKQPAPKGDLVFDDPNSDFNISLEGKRWLRNLENSTPEKSGAMKRKLRYLGRSALYKAFPGWVDLPN